MKLCSVCSNFSLHDFLHLPDSTFALRLRRLEAGQRECCLFCSFLYKQLQENLLSFEVHPSKTWVRLRNRPQTLGGRHVNERQADRSPQLHELELYAADTQFEIKAETRTDGIFLGLAANADSAAAREGAVVGRFHGNEPGANESIASILEWLSSCLKHDRCCRTASGICEIDALDVALPSRCIEVSHKKMYLRDTAGQRGVYVTLSHRWNEETEHCKTTTENLDQRRQGRGFGSLPQTFQDAMLLTQRLGIRYIWIDSFCIIQDGDGGADWQREAAQMSGYYQSSLLTISFVNQIPMRGILDARDIEPFQSILRMPYTDSSRNHNGWYYIYRPLQRSSVSFIADVRESELLRRGWIFQEWFLSRRTIFCTPDQLYFECQTGPPINERRQMLMVKPEDDAAVRLRNKLQSDSSSDIWYGVVEMYSKTSLTETSKDHLVALSGIASEFRQKLTASSKPGSQTTPHYVSGLWFDDLHQGLLWQTRPSSGRACSCSAPSWSWLSRQGEVKWLPRSPKARNAFRVKALRDSLSQLHEEADLRRWQELVNATSIDPFDTMSMTAGIMLVGQVRLVLVQHLLQSTKDSEHKLLPGDTVSTLARETDVHLQDLEPPDIWKRDQEWLYAAGWLLVSGLTTPTVIGGWALLDETRYVQRLDGYEAASLLALHVTTRRKTGITNVPLDHRRYSVRRDVYEVLFLEPLEDTRYRRIGVGRIFDSQIIADLAASDQVEIELV